VTLPAAAACVAAVWCEHSRADVLAANQVPLAAATYLDDMYVDYNLAQVCVCVDSQALEVGCAG
jgi:hypothetical protein